MPLPLWNGIRNHADGAERIHVDGCSRHRPVLLAGAFALDPGLEGRDVAHVRLAGLDSHRIADTVEPAFRARPRARPLQLLESAEPHGFRDDTLVVARI